MTEKKHKPAEQAGNEPQPEPEMAPASETQASSDPEAVIESLETMVPSAEFEALQRELEDTRAKRDEYLDGWQRALAEFSNYKKRVERDRELQQQALSGTLIKRYLEILDDLERALKKRPTGDEGAGWAEGIDLIYRKFLAILESQGVKPMEALGLPFDPSRHEAIGQEDAPGQESGTVTEIIQQGYLIGDRVLRPALVRIAI